SARQPLNSRAVSIDPVSTTVSASGCDTSARPVSPSSVRTTCSTSRGTPAPASAAYSAPAATSVQAGTAGAGLTTTAEPAASAASTEPMGIATGKFHGGVTTVTRDGVKRAPSVAG